MYHILGTLIEITIYSVILYAVILLFKWLFRRHLSPVLNYAVWALLILRLVIPVTINSDMRLFVIPEAPHAQPLLTQAEDDKSEPIVFEQTGHTTTVNEIKGNVPTVNYKPGSTVSGNVSINAYQPKTKVPEIDWQTAMVMLWAAGAVGNLAYMLFLSKRITRNVNKQSVSADSYILEHVEACKKDMRIKADIKVLVQDWLDTPALTASLRPKLLLPKSMLSMSAQQMKYGIRHELMHYRHRDYLTVLLLLLLRCVYWFNPVVWLASRQIETDMETACDVRVTSRLGKLERVDYAQTMIDLGSKANAYMLGMGMRCDRRSMEKRVRGIFMGTRTKLSVKLAALLLSCLLVFTCFTTACQPIHEEPVISKEANEAVENAEAAVMPAFETVAEPEPNPNEGFGHFPDWVENYSIPNLEVDINAKIVTPDTDVFPVYKVKQASFDTETLQRFLDYFAGNVVGVREFSFTEDELKEQLKYMKEHDAKQKDTIKDLKEQIAAAQPETFAPIDKNATMIGSFVYQTADGGRINFMADNDWCGISKYTGNYAMQLEEWVRNSGWPHLFRPMDKALAASVITEQQAMDLATKAVNDLGIENMGVIGADRAVIVNTCLDAFPSAGWYVNFGRTVNGSVPADLSLQDSIFFNFSQEDYFERWRDETLGFYVDDEGVESISWSSPKTVSEVTGENAALLPWDSAQQAIRDAMSLGYSNFNEIIEDNDEIYDTNIVIDKIVLTNVLVPQGDDLDYQLMVPAWVVYNKDVWEYEGQRGEGTTMIFAVNAIDGSVIDLNFRTHEMDRRAEERRKEEEEN